MVRILTASGWSQSPKILLNQVNDLFGNAHPVSGISALDWQVETEFQTLQDFFDTREFHEIISKVSNEIAAQCKSRDEIVIISYSTGSLIIESALSILDQSPISLPITHVMLAPAINGSSWAKLGKYAKAAIVTSAAVGLSSSKLSSFWKVILGSIGLTALRSFYVDEDILDKLIEELDPNHFDFATIDRLIFVGSEDNVVRDVPQDIPSAIYYVGDYNHAEVGDLTEKGCEQMYDTNHYGSPVSVTKLHILQHVLGTAQAVDSELKDINSKKLH